ncbi:MAG TPA: hypothetical protein VK736_06395 [Candidatus Binatia bacterium]|nr:hypothetical protein [Candidatus Binatia bacterium]
MLQVAGQRIHVHVVQLADEGWLIGVAKFRHRGPQALQPGQSQRVDRLDRLLVAGIHGIPLAAMGDLRDPDRRRAIADAFAAPDDGGLRLGGLDRIGQVGDLALQVALDREGEQRPCLPRRGIGSRGERPQSVDRRPLEKGRVALVDRHHAQLVALPGEGSEVGLTGLGHEAGHATLVGDGAEGRLGDRRPAGGRAAGARATGRHRLRRCALPPG